MSIYFWVTGDIDPSDSFQRLLCEGVGASGDDFFEVLYEPSKHLKEKFDLVEFVWDDCTGKERLDFVLPGKGGLTCSEETYIKLKSKIEIFDNIFLLPIALIKYNLDQIYI